MQSPILKKAFPVAVALIVMGGGALILPNVDAIAVPDPGHLFIRNDMEKDADGNCVGPHRVGYRPLALDYPHNVTTVIDPVTCGLSAIYRWPEDLPEAPVPWTSLNHIVVTTAEHETRVERGNELHANFDWTTRDTWSGYEDCPGAAEAAAVPRTGWAGVAFAYKTTGWSEQPTYSEVAGQNPCPWYGQGWFGPAQNVWNQEFFALMKPNGEAGCAVYRMGNYLSLECTVSSGFEGFQTTSWSGDVLQMDAVLPGSAAHIPVPRP